MEFTDDSAITKIPQMSELSLAFTFATGFIVKNTTCCW